MTHVGQRAVTHPVGYADEELVDDGVRGSERVPIGQHSKQTARSFVRGAGCKAALQEALQTPEGQQHQVHDAATREALQTPKDEHRVKGSTSVPYGGGVCLPVTVNIQRSTRNTKKNRCTTTEPAER